MTGAILVACVASTLFMVGVTWFVQVVHYPLFAEVGPEVFDSFHEAHSRRTTWVVALPMLVELVSSLALLFSPPDGLELLAAIGAALAISVWVVTLAWAAPTHSAIGRDGPDHSLLARLNRASLVRTWLWTFHGVVVLVMAADLVGA